MNSCATCRLNAMLWERCRAMAFHPLKAQLPLSIHLPILSGPKDALQFECPAFDPERTWQPLLLQLEQSGMLQVKNVMGGN